MNITPELKEFIQVNAELIKNNDFEILFNKAIRLDIEDRLALNQILKEAGVDILIYTNRVPYRYFTHDKIKEIKIPSNIKVIESEAFAYCTDLEIIYLPKNLTDIKYNAFFDCFSLRDVYYKGTKDQWKKIYINTSNVAIFEAEIHCIDGDIIYVQSEEAEWIMY